MDGIASVGNPPTSTSRPASTACCTTAATSRAITRIITLIGHRHASTDRFGVWIERGTARWSPVYESFDYNDMPIYQYDSISKNPMPDVEHRPTAATAACSRSKPGDQLHFVCDITNRSGGTLRFANE